ncbi:MAG: sugar phosphate isomerase/epimerase [Planctomycetia bacterium]|nr:sugar phosphate isomerase/epimerase [Planctomycetia bacterium]
MMSLFFRRPAGIILTAAAVAVSAGAIRAADEGAAAQTPKNMVAIRLASYYDAEPEALSHAASCGFKYVFMNIVAPDKVEETKERLAKHGLKVAVFRGDTDLSRPGSVDELAGQLATCQKMGVHYMFLSPKHTGVSKEVAIERLKKIGEVAKKCDVVIGLETHRDLGTNGDVHVETMKAINHPNIRVNFDCGNITYYNKGTDAVTELKKCIDYVGTFEIKDHNGEYETWNFPVLGTGVVDIPGVVKLLGQHGYTGPITLEIEGVQGVKRSKDEIKKEIAASADYVRSLGLLD